MPRVLRCRVWQRLLCCFPVITPTSCHSLLLRLHPTIHCYCAYILPFTVIAPTSYHSLFACLRVFPNVTLASRASGAFRLTQIRVFRLWVTVTVLLGNACCTKFKTQPDALSIWTRYTPARSRFGRVTVVSGLIPGQDLRFYTTETSSRSQTSPEARCDM